MRRTASGWRAPRTRSPPWPRDRRPARRWIATRDGRQQLGQVAHQHGVERAAARDEDLVGHRGQHLAVAARDRLGGEPGQRREQIVLAAARSARAAGRRSPCRRSRARSTWAAAWPGRGARCSSASSAASMVPRAARRPSRSKASLPAEAARATASSGMLPGALSKATSSSRSRPTSVTLAMPPMFCSARRRPGRAEQQVIDQRHQRRPLAAGGDVAHAEVADHRAAGALGDHRRLADLQRRAQAARGARVVHRGLAVRADEVDVLDRDARRRRRRRAPRPRRPRRAARRDRTARRRRPAPGGRCVRAAGAGTAWSRRRARRRRGALADAARSRTARRRCRRRWSRTAGPRRVRARAARAAASRRRSGSSVIAPRCGYVGPSPMSLPRRRRSPAIAGRHVADDRAQRALVLDQQLLRARRRDARVVHDQRDLGASARLFDQPARRQRRRRRDSVRTIRIARAHSLALVGRTSTIRPP